jgi:predicted glycoside hydrolase/deacetylase ChbG (UPF0249 family)
MSSELRSSRHELQVIAMSKPRSFRQLCAVVAMTIALALTASAQVPTDTIIRRLGYPADAKLLIIHADDMGMAHSVNRATFEALEKGWITSASIMVPCPWFPEAAEYAREHPDLDLGLHLTLTSEWKTYRWGPISDGAASSLLDKHGYFPNTETALAAQAMPVDVEKEIRAQIEKAHAAGVNFTHLDSHMGALFKTPELFRVYEQAARDYHVPNLVAPKGSPHSHPADVIPANTLVITQDLQIRPGVPRKRWLKAYEHMLAPLGPGIYELIVHLGYDDAELEGITSGHPHWGARWRQSDLEVVRSPQFQKFLRENGFILVRWKDLARAADITRLSAAGP